MVDASPKPRRQPPSTVERWLNWSLALMASLSVIRRFVDDEYSTASRIFMIVVAIAIIAIAVITEVAFWRGRRRE